ncbi:MAG: hypothetical protein SGJ27_16455 [Candidatus Melainabacteria bacterium]|nr:hypothetical protein [Candidatus Melainabacteria bacterium]
MSDYSQHVRLGDLLMEAGILSSTYIKDALERYEEEGLPIGKVLVVSGYLSDNELRNALNLQYMVNDRLLTRKDAVEVLKTSHTNRLTLEESFRKTGLVQPEEQETNKLGQLLVDSGNVDEERVEESLKASSSTGLPLGHILCHLNLISQAIINRALLIQQFVRRGQIMRNQGIDSLRFAGDREERLEKLQINRGYKRQPLRNTPLMGDLLLSAGVATDRQIREAQLAHITHNSTFGKALVDTHQLPEEFVMAAVVIQEMIDNNTLELERAREALIEVRAKGVSPTRAVAEACTFRLPLNQSRALLELLSAVGAVDIRKLPVEIQERAGVNYNQVLYLCRSLSSSGTVEDQVLYSALRLVDLKNRELIEPDKAIMVLDFAVKSDTDIEYALYMMGVTERTRLREVDVQSQQIV